MCVSVWEWSYKPKFLCIIPTNTFILDFFCPLSPCRQLSLKKKERKKKKGNLLPWNIFSHLAESYLETLTLTFELWKSWKFLQVIEREIFCLLFHLRAVLNSTREGIGVWKPTSIAGETPARVPLVSCFSSYIVFTLSINILPEASRQVVISNGNLLSCPFWSVNRFPASQPL